MKLKPLLKNYIPIKTPYPDVVLSIHKNKHSVCLWAFKGRVIQTNKKQEFDVGKIEQLIRESKTIKEFAPKLTHYFVPM